MHIVHVFIRIKPDCLAAFQAASLTNATASIREPGIARFDFLQQADDPMRFVLVEVYRTPADQAAHRETAHYAAWRDTVAPMMAEPRIATKFVSLFPGDGGW
jgi:autoinducer 2-degrading protein